MEFQYKQYTQGGIKHFLLRYFHIHLQITFMQFHINVFTEDTEMMLWIIYSTTTNAIVLK